MLNLRDSQVTMKTENTIYQTVVSFYLKRSLADVFPDSNFMTLDGSSYEVADAS